MANAKQWNTWSRTPSLSMDRLVSFLSVGSHPSIPLFQWFPSTLRFRLLMRPSTPSMRPLFRLDACRSPSQQQSTCATMTASSQVVHCCSPCWIQSVVHNALGTDPDPTGLKGTDRKETPKIEPTMGNSSGRGRKNWILDNEGTRETKGEKATKEMRLRRIGSIVYVEQSVRMEEVGACRRFVLEDCPRSKDG